MRIYSYLSLQEKHTVSKTSKKEREHLFGSQIAREGNNRPLRVRLCGRAHANFDVFIANKVALIELSERVNIQCELVYMEMSSLNRIIQRLPERMDAEKVSIYLHKNMRKD